jgi:hypothetical protein
MREELAALLRLTQQVEQDAGALARAIAAEVARDRRRVPALVRWAGDEAWRWN